MIKTTAAKKSASVSNANGSSEKEHKPVASESIAPTNPDSKPQWSALQDDYMLQSKLKDWDKESSDDDSMEEELNDENLDGEEEEQAASAGKKRRIGVR